MEAWGGGRGGGGEEEKGGRGAGGRRDTYAMRDDATLREDHENRGTYGKK